MCVGVVYSSSCTPAGMCWAVMVYRDLSTANRSASKSDITCGKRDALDDCHVVTVE